MSVLREALELLVEKEAAVYVDHIATTLLRRPRELSSLPKKKKTKIAHLLTGLFVLSKPSLRSLLGVSTNVHGKLVRQLSSNPHAAHHVVKAGSKLPSKVLKFEKWLDLADRLTDSDRDEFTKELHAIYTRTKGT